MSKQLVELSAQSWPSRSREQLVNSRCCFPVHGLAGGRSKGGRLYDIIRTVQLPTDKVRTELFLLIYDEFPLLAGAGEVSRIHDRV